MDINTRRKGPPTSTFFLSFFFFFFFPFVLSSLSLSYIDILHRYIYILLYNYIGLSENSLCPIPMDHQNDPHQNCWENTLDTPILYIYTVHILPHAHTNTESNTRRWARGVCAGRSTSAATKPRSMAILGGNDPHNPTYVRDDMGDKCK